MKTYLLSLFVFICISNVNATNYVVSGAGTTEVNGTYVESGTYNGVPYYQYVNGATTYSLVYDGYGSWFIVDGTDNCYPNGCWSNSWYTNNSNASTPPTSSWYADIMSFGNAPYPSVQIEAPLITYSSTSFLESSNNDGSISNNSITITYNKYGGDALSGSNGEDFLSSGKATLTHLPTGLTATLIRNNDGALTFTVSGNASSHLHADNINNLNLQFYNSAFVGGDASIVVNALQAMTITFIQSWTVASTGADFSTITSAVTSSSVLNYDILLLAAETFTEENIIVNKSLIFKGQGAGSTIIQANATYNTATHLVFNIGGNLTYVKFYDLTIQNGNNIKLTGSDPEYGGGIYSSSPLSLYNCVIKNNINNIYGGVGSGGGVYAGSTLLMNGCLIYGNLSTTTNTVTQNEIGGGVYVDSACTIINSTFSGNTATGALGRGGGLCLASGNHIITNCTFTGNTAGKDGGGIYYLGSESATITNTIIYGNTSTNNLYKDLSFGTLNGLYSIVGTMNSGAINGTSTNVSNADPMLNSLADNGGPTETISLQSGSPAIDAGTSTGAPALDQRGYGRNGATDIGAFEYGGTTSCSTIAPTGTASQSFCSAASPTVADLAATGTAIQWYAASSGGAALGTTDALTNATHYFATQTIGCESSNRLDVTVTVNSTPSASITGSNAFLSGDSVLFTTTTNASTPSYLWSNAKTSSTIWVKTSGNYSVTITDGSTGCSKSATKSITAVTIGNTSLLASYCPFTVAALNSYIYCKSVLGGVTKYQYELKNTNLAYCDSAESGSSSTAISLSQFSGLHYATTYDVRVRAYKSGVWGKFSSVCQITTPSVPNTGLNSISCGATVAALNSYVYCTSVSGATDYQYEITDTARNRVDTITVGGTQLAIPLSRLPIVHYATTYRVRVRAQKGGDWGSFTRVCRVSTPSIPNTGLKSISCGLTVAALNSYVYCSSVSGATDYQYEFTDSVRNTIDIISAGGPQLAISLSRLPIVHYATTYRVRVRAQHGGNWGSFAGVCRVSTPSIPNTGLNSTSCGLTVAALNSYVYCTSVSGATNYQYEITDTARNRVDTITVGGTQLAIPLSRLPIVHYATTYRVRVRAKKGGDWGTFASVCRVSTPSIPNTGLKSISCGVTVAALNSYVYCSSVTGATDYQYEFTDTARNRVDTITVGGTQLAIPLSRLPIVNYATTYRVRVRAQKGAVWGAFTGVCRVTTPSIPNTGLKSISCGLTVAALNSYVYCSSVSGATDYQYEFTDSVRNTIDTISAGGPQLAISLSRLPIVHYATTYRVRVRAQHGGNWGAFTGVCRVTTPSIPSTSLATCNSNVANTSSNIYCNSVPGATDYSYEISNTMLGYSDTIAKNANNTSISLSSFTGLQTGETYNVRVRVFKTPDWGPFGSVCTFHIGSSGRFGHDQATGVLADVKETEIKVYPNPFNESFIILSNSSTSVNVKIIDQFGRLCQKYTLTGNTSHRIGEGLASGLYMVEAITGEERKIFKVVKME